jgi:hypothetical protein
MSSTPSVDGAPEGARALAPPPGCPAHAGSDAYGPGGLARIYGVEHRTDPMGLYERLRAEYGAVAPVLMEGDLPAWLVLGYRENLEVARSAGRFTRDSRLWKSQQDGDVADDSPLLPLVGWQPLCVFVDCARRSPTASTAWTGAACAGTSHVSPTSSSTRSAPGARPT